MRGYFEISVYEISRSDSTWKTSIPITGHSDEQEVLQEGSNRFFKIFTELYLLHVLLYLPLPKESANVSKSQN